MMNQDNENVRMFYVILQADVLEGKNEAPCENIIALFEILQDKAWLRLHILIRRTYFYLNIHYNI